MFRRGCSRNGFINFTRYYSEGTTINTTNQNLSQHSVKADVPGLSSAVIHSSTNPVGPGVEPNKTGAYKVPEYFCYDNMSFFEAEIEMAKFRLPQPSAIKK